MKKVNNFEVTEKIKNKSSCEARENERKGKIDEREKYKRLRQRMNEIRGCTKFTSKFAKKCHP